MPTLVCPLCGEVQDPEGPGVGSIRAEGVPDKEWQSYWIPSIEDLRGTPGRLVHPECSFKERSITELMTLVTEHARRNRLELARAWSK
jgi:hypothetical protein